MTPSTPSLQFPATSGLEPIQAILADLAGDMIGRGTTDATACLFVRALLQHEAKISLYWSDKGTLPHGHDAEIEETTRRLVRAWPSERPIEAMPATDNAAAALIRAQVRKRLAVQLQAFLNRATGEEASMMLDLLEHRESQAGSHLDTSNGLAHEMAMALDKADGLYIRVDPNHERAVQAFGDQLHRANDEAARRASRERIAA